MNTNIVFACFVMIGALFKEYLCIVKFSRMFLKSRIWDIIFQILTPIVLVGLYSTTNLLINMGEFRLYTMLAFILGYFLYGMTFYKLLDKLHKVIYNKLTIGNGIKYTKFCRFVLK